MEYWFDSEDRIAKVGQGWKDFAATNGAPGLTEESVRGLALTDFIEDRTTAYLWRLLLQKARAGTPVSLTLRCDGPSRKRRIRVCVECEGTLSRVSTTLLSDEARREIPLLAAGRREASDFLHCCSWCERFQLGDGSWGEIEDLMKANPLFESTDVPPVTHGICPSCLKSVLATVDEESAPA
jgi:hypothetical protein